MKNILTFIFILVMLSGLGQSQQYIDSLKADARVGEDKTALVKTLNRLSKAYLYTNPDSAAHYARLSIDVAIEIGNKIKEGDSYICLGNSYWASSEHNNAVEQYKNALRVYQEAKHQQGIANSNMGIGLIYKIQANYPKALEYYFEALAILQKHGSSNEIANICNNIGQVYRIQQDYPKALEYYQMALEEDRKGGNKGGVAASLNNIGLVHDHQGNFKKALNYYFKSLSLEKEMDHKRGIASSFNNIANLYSTIYELGDSTIKATTPWAVEDHSILLDSALHYQSLALEIQKNMGSEDQMIYSLYGIAGIHLKRGNYRDALDHFDHVVDLAEEVGALNKLFEAHEGLSESYENLSEYQQALYHYKRYSRLKDSIFNQEKSRDIGKLEAKAQYDKQKAIEEAEHRKELEKQQAIAAVEENRQRLIIIAVSIGLVLVAFFSVFIFNRFRVTRKQKNTIQKQRDEVQHQKIVVEEKNKEILDSINYAKRLQDAILPAPKVVKEYLGESFILYKPKDIVAGDFYWLETIGATNNSSSQQRRSLSRVEGDALSGVEGDALSGVEGRSSAKASDAKGWSYIAAADCTGHGVPGAMVSVVCSNALSKALIEEGITDTGKLLDRTRELVIERFGKTDAEIKDGMDISLAAIRHDGKQVRWSGANNPLWVVKGKDSDSDWDSDSALMEIKADKQPIGKYTHSKPFTQHTIDLGEGDTFYMLSDGFPDQFGGEKGKKYKSGKLKKFLLSIQDKSMSEQKQLLDQEFERWRGALEQIDDVCVIGVRL